MNIQQFNYVLAVAEHRHFETAAEKCFIAQSTLSTMISKLENEIGIQIFNRKTKPVGITKEGEEIIKQLKIITNEIDQLTEKINELKGEMKGKIKIGCIHTVAPFLLPLFLVEFSQKYPNLEIEIKENTTAEIIQKLKTRELDIGIVSTPVEDNEFENHPLYREGFILFNTNSSNQKKIGISDINLNNFWLLEEGHCLRDQVLHVCETKNRKINSSVNINFKAGSIDSLLRFTKANQGKTILPCLSILNFNQQDSQHLIPLKEKPSREIGLITHPHFAKQKTLKLLKDEIRKAVEKIDGIAVIRN